MKRNKKNPDVHNDCPVCRSNFLHRNVSLGNQGKNKAIFHANCPRCRSSVLIICSKNSQDAVSMGVITDLDGTEVSDKFNGELISSDEIMDAYQILHNERE